MNSKGCAILFYIPFVLVGIGGIVLTIYFSNLAFQSKNWLPTEAKVEHVELKSTTQKGKNGNYTTTKKTILSYTYSMGKTEFTGEDVCLGYSQSNVEDYDAIYYKIRYASKIKVFVNPDNFSQSVVVTGFSNTILVMLLVTLFWNSMLCIFLSEGISGDKQNSVLRIGFFTAIISFFCAFAVAKGYININHLAENIVILERG